MVELGRPGVAVYGAATDVLDTRQIQTLRSNSHASWFSTVHHVDPPENNHQPSVTRLLRPVNSQANQAITLVRITDLGGLGLSIATVSTSLRAVHQDLLIL